MVHIAIAVLETRMVPTIPDNQKPWRRAWQKMRLSMPNRRG